MGGQVSSRAEALHSGMHCVRALACSQCPGSRPLRKRIGVAGNAPVSRKIRRKFDNFILEVLGSRS